MYSFILETLSLISWIPFLVSSLELSTKIVKTKNNKDAIVDVSTPLNIVEMSGFAINPITTKATINRDKK